ncbi:tetratricopeptide repeat protein [Fusobacterium sp. PH5-44]|uniref:tetratricopeptide repeat protein n=1 Tax=unclassified Fusobacterium TaxID=2648384 RepID=UPI003D1E0CBD
MKKLIALFSVICSICLLGTTAVTPVSEEEGPKFKEFRSPALISIDSNGKTGGFDKALDEHLNNYNRDGNLIFLLGNQYFKMGKYEKAFRVFSRGTGNKNYFGAATTSRLMGDYEVALDYYNKIDKVTDKRMLGEVYLGRGLAHRGMQSYQNAINDLRKYLNYSRSENLYITIAAMHAKLEEYEQAVTLLERAPKTRVVNNMLLNMKSEMQKIKN